MSAAGECPRWRRRCAAILAFRLSAQKKRACLPPASFSMSAFREDSIPVSQIAHGTAPVSSRPRMARRLAPCGARAQASSAMLLDHGGRSTQLSQDIEVR